MAAIGEVLVLEYFTFNDDGDPSNATTVTVSVLLPDGTYSAPTVTNTGTGTYEATFTATLAGLHGVKWLATGDNASAKEDAFQVDPDTAPAVGLSEVKDHLNVTGTDLDRDAELIAFIQSAQSAIEARCGALTRRACTETHNGGTVSLLLREPSILSVTSVTENGSTVAADGYAVNATAGILTRVSGYSASCWSDGFGNIEVQYVAGRSVIPPDLRQGVLELVRHLWDTQRGQQRGPRSGDDYTPGIGYSLPNRVKELIGPYETPGLA